MKQMNRTIFIISTLLLGVLAISCKHNEKREYHTVIDKVMAESENYKDISISSDKFNENLKTVTVIENGFEFKIPERKSEISGYNCNECHSEPLSNLKQSQVVNQAAHWNIKMKHAGAETMNCTTCHNEKNMDNLQSITKAEIDFNYSYKLCGQCHQNQYKDWQGGSHGKQLGGWAPPRLSNTCVNCHNPHSPQIEKRWPSRFNTQIEKERK